MTLCLTWKNGNEIFFASDSRLTNNHNEVMTDDASKIFKIDVKIFGPTPADMPNAKEPIIHQTSFGICFSGSYLNGSIIADTIEEILSNVQGSEQYSDFKIERLFNIAFSIYKQISTQLMKVHRQYGLSKVLIGGYCPISSEFALNLFKPINDEITGMVSFENESINLEDNIPYFIGDQNAIKYAQELIPNIKNHYTHFHLLREVMKNPDFLTVGGNIQAAKFRPKEFETYGIAENTIEETEQGPKIIDTYTFRGYSIDFNQDDIRDGNLNIRKKLFNPFQHERDENFRKIMKNHWGIE
jgi:hypothetical protein